MNLSRTRNYLDLDHICLMKLLYITPKCWVEKHKSHSLLHGLIKRINIIYENENSKEKSRGVEGVTRCMRDAFYLSQII